MDKYEAVYQLKRRGKMKSEEDKRNVVRWLVVMCMVVFLLGAITPMLSTAAELEKVEQKYIRNGRYSL
jgi:cell division septal protein FtsQ